MISQMRRGNRPPGERAKSECRRIEDDFGPALVHKAKLRLTTNDQPHATADGSDPIYRRTPSNGRGSTASTRTRASRITAPRS